MKRLIVGLFVIFAFMFSLSVFPALAQPNDYCEGNFDCDSDVDGTDAAVFKSDFGRSPFKNPCPNCPPPAQVPKTGQTTSYATGDDGDLEKGLAWQNPRFTDNGDGTITDNFTGLIWLKDANCFGETSWGQAISNSNGLASGACGLTDGSSAGDWRLPNYKELFSLIDAEYYNPALPSGHPFTNVHVLYYWSSTTSASLTIAAWCVMMHDGRVVNFVHNDSNIAWPVRDPL